VVTPETDAVAALQLKFGLTTPSTWISETLDTFKFDFFPEILGISRRQLIGLLDLPVKVEKRAVTKKVLKARSGIETAIEELTTKVPARIEELKKLIKESEELIHSWGKKVMELRRAEDDILDKSTREKYKYEEKKQIEQYEQEKRELQRRVSRLDALKQRLATWGERPEDHEIVTVDEDFVVTFAEKFELSKRYLEDHPDDTIDGYLAVLSEHDLLKDISRRFRNYPTIDRWRYLENEIIFQAIRWRLVQPIDQMIKKYPWLDQTTSGRPEHYENDFEEGLIIKTGGASIGVTVYGAGKTWGGQQRQLSTFDRPVTNGNKSDSGASSPPGGFYSEIDSGDFGEDK